MSARIHTEETFEAAIEAALITDGGYVRGSSQNFDPEIAMDPGTLFTFLENTQPEKWERIRAIHGSSVREKLLHRLVREIDLRGILDVIRYGFTDFGVRFDVAYFRPETTLNPQTEALYQANILTVMRQVYYSTRHPNSLDRLLSLNGLPAVTIELTNQLTGQTADQPKQQSWVDRDESQLLFQFTKLALVHLAVDTDEASMTTRLQGAKTFYLPFNQAYQHGRGNPPNPGGDRTAYLWEEVWQKDSLMEILGKFMHLESEEVRMGNRVKKKETMFFPRYHQREGVRQLVASVRGKGAGENCLIQHSAGRGQRKALAL